MRITPIFANRHNGGQCPELEIRSPYRRAVTTETRRLPSCLRDYIPDPLGMDLGLGTLEVAAGFEVGAVGAHELAFLLIEMCPAIRTGAFDLLDLGCITGAGRHAVCHPAFLCRSTPPDGPGSSQHLRADPQTW